MNRNEHPPVAIIIPNFNGSALMRRNLPFVLAAAEAYPGSCRVIVVDDASSDGSVRMVQETFPEIDLIRQPVNRGFAEAVHSGVAHADSECLIFLNSDVRPSPDFVEPLIVQLDQTDLFSVSPLVVDERGESGDESWRCYTIQRGRLRMVDRAGRMPLRPILTLFASGGSMAVRKSKFLELGGFLPLFKPFYSEDVDLGLRAWRRGWRSLLEPRSRIVHDHTDSSINTHVPSSRVKRVRRRNRFLLEWIHVPSDDLRRSLIPRYLLQLTGRLLRFDYLYLAGLVGALIRIPSVLATRAELERTDVLGFWEIMTLIHHSLEEGMDP